MPEAPHTTDLSTRWRRARGVVHRNLPEGVLLLAAGMDTPLGITGPASSLWALLAQDRTRQEVSAELARAYGASTEQIDHDLDGTWEELVASRIIEPVGP